MSERRSSRSSSIKSRAASEKKLYTAGYALGLFDGMQEYDPDVVEDSFDGDEEEAIEGTIEYTFGNIPKSNKLAKYNQYFDGYSDGFRKGWFRAKRRQNAQH